VVTVETGVYDGSVVLVLTDDGNGNHTEIVMSPDECREFSNNLGAAIQAASATRTGVMT